MNSRKPLASGLRFALPPMTRLKEAELRMLASFRPEGIRAYHYLRQEHFHGFLALPLPASQSFAAHFSQRRSEGLLALKLLLSCLESLEAHLLDWELSYLLPSEIAYSPEGLKVLSFPVPLPSLRSLDLPLDKQSLALFFKERFALPSALLMASQSFLEEKDLPGLRRYLKAQEAASPRGSLALSSTAPHPIVNDALAFLWYHGKRLAIRGEERLLGRDPVLCDLVLPSPAVGRQHAQLLRHGRSFFLKDLGSKNGSYLNGRRLEKQRPELLPERCVIHLANCRLDFSTEAALRAAPTWSQRGGRPHPRALAQYTRVRSGARPRLHRK